MQHPDKFEDKNGISEMEMPFLRDAGLSDIKIQVLNSAD